MLLAPRSAPNRARRPQLPRARGPLTEQLFDVLRATPGRPFDRFGGAGDDDSWPGDDPLSGEDAPLALYALYELHYRGFAAVDEEWEWDPSLLAFRQRLEHDFVTRLRREVDARFGSAPITPEHVATEMVGLAGNGGGPSLSAFMATHGTLEQMREFAIHRSLYQRKEADPHTWGIPRLHGTAKAALVSIQTDEYGGGRRADMHAELFGAAMRELDLDPEYGAYLDVVPGVTLSTVNLVSHFGLHRRWRGALVGHLALFEMCSVTPMGRYCNALERMGVPGATPFYDAHVVADEWHEKIALDELVGGLVADEPHLSSDVVFGARALDHTEGALTAHLLDAWSRGTTSLLD